MPIHFFCSIDTRLCIYVFDEIDLKEIFSKAFSIGGCGVNCRCGVRNLLFFYLFSEILEIKYWAKRGIAISQGQRCDHVGPSACSAKLTLGWVTK